MTPADPLLLATVRVSTFLGPLLQTNASGFFFERDFFVAELHARLPEKQKPDTSKLIMSPMPGLVVSVAVHVGQDVKAGEAVCIVEAMKMQNIIRAEADGVVKTVNAAAGASVAADEVLVEFA